MMQGKAVFAVQSRNYDLLRQLVGEGDDINRLDFDGRTPLMHAVLGDADAEMVAFLLDLGADPNTHDRLLGWTALHYAVRDGKQTIVALLLAHGADPEVEDVFGDTPLWRCVTGNSPSPTIMRLLIEHGANPLRSHPMGISARDIADSLDHPDLAAALRCGTA